MSRVDRSGVTFSWGLLCPRREGRRRRSPEKQDEFAPPHLIGRPLSSDPPWSILQNLPHTQLACVNWITLG
jgi:hypothetical protein